MSTQPRTTHKLKIWPEYFKQVRDGRMKFQLRRNDRGYRVGDQLLLKECNPHDRWCKTYFGDNCDCSGKNGLGSFTNRELLVRVDYIMDAPSVDELTNTRHSDSGYVIMSISLVN